MLERKAEPVISQDLYALRQKFNQLFSYAWDFIVKETPKSNWKTVKKYKLTEQKCWYKYIDPEQIIGLRFGTQTNHGLYDIDWGSIHDPREQEKSLSALKAELEEYGIVSFVLLQSSDSGGLHLYFFLDRAVNTFRLACAMNKAAFDAGLEIKRGQLETFPNTKRYNSLFNGHRLPLQQGSYLLDKDYTPYSSRLEHFLNAANKSAASNDTDLLESRLESAYEWFLAQKNTERVYNPTPEDREFIEQVDYAQREIKEGFLHQVRSAIEQGFTGESETNELLLTIAKLGRILHGLSGQPYIDYITETVTSCPGYVKYCRHQHEIKRRCTEVARYGEQHWYPYRSTLPQNRATYKQIKQSLTNQTNLNLERQHNAQNRINQAVTIIREQRGQLPSKVGECKLAIRNITKELFGISISDATLSKPQNLPLWHPKHRTDQTNTNTTPKPKSTVTTEKKVTAKKIKTANNQTRSSQPDQKLVIQKTLHTKQPYHNQSSDCATPPHVICKNKPNTKTPKSIPSQASSISCHTLPYMKGVWVCANAVLSRFLISISYQLLQRAYLSALTKNRNLKTLSLNYQGYDTGYETRGASGLVEVQLQKLNQKQKQPKRKLGEIVTKLQSISPDTEVVICRNQLHSTHLNQIQPTPSQILIYIKPLEKHKQWRGGIAVPIELVEPLRLF